MPFLLLFFLTLTLIITPVDIKAQTITPTPAGAQQSRKWSCLEIEYCLDTGTLQPAKKNGVPVCAGEGFLGHRVKLSTIQKADEKPLAQKDTYIITCLSTTGGQMCTTGDSEADKIVYGEDMTAKMKTALQYEFQGMFEKDGKTLVKNPVKTDTNANFGPVEWQDYSAGHVRKYSALNYFDPVNAPTASGVGGQQQSTMDFDTLQKNCGVVAWDPYGRIFDSETLQPLSSAPIQIWKQRVNGTFTLMNETEDTDDFTGGVFKSTINSSADGRYSFVVTAGTFQLKLPGLTIQDDPTKIHPNYAKIYSNIYKTDEAFEEKNELVHKDIPVSNGTAYLNSELKYEYIYEAVPGTGSVTISGNVSSPFAKILVYSKIPDPAFPGQTDKFVQHRLLKDNLTANSEGDFAITITENYDLSIGEEFGIVKFERSDLTTLTKEKSILKRTIAYVLNKIGIVKEVQAQAQTATLTLDPIPTYLEGFAYDTNNQPLANSKVAVYLKFGGTAYHETQTDEQGYFRITSEYLPNMPYTLKYTAPTGQIIPITTSKFISQNKETIVKNKISLSQYKNEKGKVMAGTVPPTANPSNPIGSNYTGTSGTDTGTSGSTNTGNGTGAGQESFPQITPGTQQSQTTSLIVVVIVVMITVAAGILGIYVMKKRSGSFEDGQSF